MLSWSLCSGVSYVSGLFTGASQSPLCKKTVPERRGTETGGGETLGATQTCVLDLCSCYTVESRHRLLHPDTGNKLEGRREIDRDVFHLPWCRHAQVLELNHGGHCQV